MGAAMAKSSGSRRRGRRAKAAPMTEINVTPMVDVMLVLLIVFMVAAPLLTAGVPIDLPQTQAESLNTDAKPITVSVTVEGVVYLAEAEVLLEDLVEELTAAAPDGTESRIYVRGDAGADYGSVMQVMGVLSSAGYSKIGLITQQEQGQ